MSAFFPIHEQKEIHREKKIRSKPNATVIAMCMLKFTSHWTRELGSPKLIKCTRTFIQIFFKVFVS